MANDFGSFPEVKREDFSAFPEFKAPAAERAPVTATEKQEVRDRELVESAQGIVPEAYKAGAYTAWNAALLNAPSYAIARATALRTGRPFDEVFAEQKEYEDALARRNPLASKYGTGVGLVGGVLLPGGGAAKLAQTAKAATAAKAGATAGKAAELGTAGATTGALTGVSTGFETNFDPEEMAKSAVIGAGLGAGVQAAIGPLTKYLGRVKNPIDPKTGQPTAEAQEAITRALGDKLPPDELAAVQSAIIENMKKKGPTEAAATEGFLLSQGITPPKSMVTGARPTAAASEAAELARAKAETAVGAKAAQLAPQGPIGTSVAEDLYAAERAYKTAAQAPYKEAAALEVQFADDVSQAFLPMLERKLNSANIPDLTQNLDVYPKAAKAFDRIRRISETGELPFPGDPLNARNILAIKDELNSLSRQAKGSDRVAMKAIRQSYDESVMAAVESGLFTGAGHELLEKWKTGDNLWKQYKTIYYPKEVSESGIMNRIMREMFDETGNVMPNLTESAARTAQGAINAGLMNPKLGEKVYERLEMALGANSPAMAQIKQNIRTLAFGDTTNLAKLPQKIDLLLTENIDLAKKVFSPQELSEMRRLSATLNIINKSPVSQAEKESRVARAMQTAVSIGAGIIGNQFHGLPGAIIGPAISEISGAALRGVRGARQVAAETAGAPVLRQTPEFLTNVPIRNLEAFEGAGAEPDYEALPLRTGRATGGKVSHDSISDRLVNMAERAKKEINRDTQVLLKAPDTHVAQALEIANRHIEG